MSKAKEARTEPELPTVGADNTWEWSVDGEVFRFREATLAERSKARNDALAEAPADPQFEEGARLLALVATRRRGDVQEALTRDGIMQSGERYYYKLFTGYSLGLMALEKKTGPSSDSSLGATSPIQRSVVSVRP